MLFLSKLLPLFFLPLGLALTAWVASASLWRRWRPAQVIAWGAAAGLWVAAMPLTAGWLTARVAGNYPSLAIDAVPPADVAVVLGGILDAPVPPRTEPRLSGASDRVIDAWRLYRSGKVKMLLVSGGNLPWTGAAEPEALLIKQLLVELGVPEADIAVETGSANTRENAVNTAQMLRANGWSSALLVTSASHMPRAAGAFAKAGATVIPFPTDVPPGDVAGVGTVLDLLPDAGALAKTTDALREWLGLAYYRIMGWA